jgi:hypothetical protein
MKQEYLTDRNLVYTLTQTGWDNGKPKMENDISFSIHNRKQDKNEEIKLAELIAFMLNDKEIVSISQQRLDGCAQIGKADFVKPQT